MRVGLLFGDGLREPRQRQVGGDDADEAAFLVFEGHGIGHDHVLVGEGAGIIVVERVYPAGLSLVLGSLVPHFRIVVIITLALGDDAVALSDTVGRETPHGGRVEVGFHGDGTAVDVGSECHDTVCVCQKAVGSLILVDDPLDILRDGLNI